MLGYKQMDEFQQTSAERFCSSTLLDYQLERMRLSSIGLLIDRQ